MAEGAIYTCWTKATDREPGPPRYSANLLISRRGWLRVFGDRLECGDWTIPVAGITAATLYQVGLAQVLVVATPARTYQFGLNPWVRVRDHLPFAFDVMQTKMRYSWFSIAVRVVLVAVVLYLVLR